MFEKLQYRTIQRVEHLDGLDQIGQFLPRAPQAGPPLHRLHEHVARFLAEFQLAENDPVHVQRVGVQLALEVLGRELVAQALETVQVGHVGVVCF